MRRFAFGLVLASCVLFADMAAAQVASAPSRAAVVTQIQGQLSTLQTMPKTDPGRPALLSQVAESYTALADAAARDQVSAQTRRQQFQANGSASAAAQQKVLEDQAQAVVAVARKKAIEFGSLVINDHPTYAQLDRVRMRLAQDYENAGDRKNARQVYDDLIKKHPTSQYVPQAYFALGDFYFEEAPSDASKLDLAIKAYTEVTKYPPPANSVYGLAWYKLAFAYANKGETAKARSAFKQVIDFGTSYPQLPGAAALANTARSDAAALAP